MKRTSADLNRQPCQLICRGLHAERETPPRTPSPNCILNFLQLRGEVLRDAPGLDWLLGLPFALGLVRKPDVA